MFSRTEILLWALAGNFVAIISYVFYPVYFPGINLDYDRKSFLESFISAQPRRSAFQATRLTQSTFLIKEHNDIYSEHPHIYAKVVPSANTILILDTGCGGASNDPDVEIKSLREYIETVRVTDNAMKPLNEGGNMLYVVVTSHVHYDHILGVEDFAKDSPILASSHSPTFLSLTNIPKHSLCDALHIPTPSYTPTLVPHLHEIRSRHDIPLEMVVLHTPGHTPDELALYDAGEKMLYVGDSLYEHEHIIFPAEGSIVTWFASMDYLISFVSSENSLDKNVGGSASSEVKINAGHRTVCRPALDVLTAARAFMADVVAGKERIKKRTVKRGEVSVEYEQEGGRFALICPERLVIEARN